MSIISNLSLFWNLGGGGGQADIPVSVLQVPAGDEGGPEGFPNLLKYEEQEEDEEEKKEDDDDE